MNPDTGRSRVLSGFIPPCPARAFHVRRETVKVVDGNRYICSCGCEFEWDNDFSWRVLKQNRLGNLVDAVSELAESKAALVFICREILATLSLERNFEVTIGSSELQKWIAIWRKRFKEAVGES